MSAQGDLFERTTEPTPPAPPGPLDFSCAYRGFFYATPCRAKPGEPCRWTRAGAGFHAERRIAAGERLETYEDAPGAPEVEDEPEDADEESDAIVESEKRR